MRPVFLALGLALVAVALADEFPEVQDSEPPERGRPVAASWAAAGVTVPAGFTVAVLASEPEVRNPIAMAWDDSGRLWVAENYTYAEGDRRFDLRHRDRVLVFTDTDSDGTLDRRSVFADDLQMLTGVEVGLGGVWLTCPPQLLFIPDRDRDAVPDGRPEVRLDGFEVAASNHHNFANGPRFGPDGWLYGRCGHACPARIGPPGCPDDRRLPMEGGIWRYCPRSRRAEVLTTGTTNPWGHDWNEVGEGFFVNTVNGHLWHLIPGAHFAQTNGIDPNGRTYELIDQHADHYHFDVSAGWQRSRDGAANSLGGGHAHSGCMIYAGINWPADYRGRLFTLNLHGRRVNRERLEPVASGYVARHEPDLFVVTDPWFRGIDLAAGPDGSVAILDWSDTGECHERDGVHRTSGRIYRLAHAPPRRPPGLGPEVALRSLSDESLARLQRHADGWWVRQSRLLLADRAATRPVAVDALAVLAEQFQDADTLADSDPRVSASVHRVRAVLSLHAAGDARRERLATWMRHADPHVRTWAIRLMTEGWPLDAALGPVPSDPTTTATVEREAAAAMPALTEAARGDNSGLVRLALASTLQRLPVRRRCELAAPLVARAADADDHNLPLLVWYGLMPVADVDDAALADLATVCTWPATRRLIARRLTESIDDRPAAVEQVLAAAADKARNTGSAAELADTLAGVTAGCAGRRQVPRPRVWQDVEAAIAGLPEGPDRETCEPLAAELAVVFGDGRALVAIRDTALDRRAPLATRRQAITTLVIARPPDLRPTCERLLGDRHLRVQAAAGLAVFDDDESAARLVEAVVRCRDTDRVAMLSIIASRPRFAAALLAAVEAGRLPAADLPAHVVRQMHTLGDGRLSERLDSAWGSIRETAADKRTRTAELSRQLGDPSGPAGELRVGRVVYRRLCGTCHALYGEGGGLGPDLTGAGRHDLAYLLENVIDPSAVVNRDWRLTIVVLEDGRVLDGVVVERTDRTITLQDATQQRTIAIDEIAEIRTTNRSPMPDGLLDQLDIDQIRNLIAYLRHSAQVPLPD